MYIALYLFYGPRGRTGPQGIQGETGISGDSGALTDDIFIPKTETTLMEIIRFKVFAKE
jgi:hypothetical protein